MRKNSLTNKNLVIIGGTSGLGLSAAKGFINNGTNVVVVGRNEKSSIEAKIYWINLFRIYPLFNKLVLKHHAPIIKLTNLLK